MNESFKVPVVKVGFDKKIIKYGFPQDQPIFWGPNQTLENQQYQEPVGWHYNECLLVPYIVRFCHDDGTIDSETADNTGGNSGGGTPGPRPWTLYDNSCYVEFNTCDHQFLASECAESNGFGGQSFRIQIYQGIGCLPDVEATLPVFVPIFGYITAPSTGGSPLINLNANIELIVQPYFDSDGNSLGPCYLAVYGPIAYQGSIAGAAAAGKIFLLVSITTWFWRRPAASGPDPYEYTITQWVNNRYLDGNDMTIPNPSFIDFQYCYPGQPPYPSIP